MIRRPARATLVPYTTLCRSLQCYEGQDETKALYEWDYGKQLLYTQILREKTAQLLADTGTLEEAVARVASADSAFFNEQIGRAHGLNSSHANMSYAVFCLKK